MSRHVEELLPDPEELLGGVRDHHEEEEVCRYCLQPADADEQGAQPFGIAPHPYGKAHARAACPPPCPCCLLPCPPRVARARRTPADGRLVQPCACAASVHQRCLAQWIFQSYESGRVCVGGGGAGKGGSVCGGSGCVGGFGPLVHPRTRPPTPARAPAPPRQANAQACEVCRSDWSGLLTGARSFGRRWRARLASLLTQSLRSRLHSPHLAQCPSTW